MDDEKKAGPRRLSDDETRARRAAAIAKLGYWDADLENNILHHSSEYVSVHGLPPGTVVTRQEQVLELIHPDDIERVTAEFNMVDRAKMPYSTEYRIIRPDNGEISHIQEIGEIVTDEAGTVIGHTGTSQDVTEQRYNRAKLERALAESEMNLRSRDLFLANMSHELRTPLNAISGYAELLTTLDATRLTAEKANGYVRAILQASQHLTNIISDILLQVELQRDMRPAEHQLVDIAEFVDDAIGISGLRLEPDFGHINIDIQPVDAVARFDTRLVSQALINVLGNAVKYAGLEKGITVGFRPDAAGCYLFVEDHGDGMTKLEIQRAREPFFRGAQAVRKAIPGTGLGLSLTHRIMALHGGRLEITKAEHGGTRVTFYFPS